MVKYRSFPNNGEDTTSSGLDPVIFEIFVIDLLNKSQLLGNSENLNGDQLRFDVLDIVTCTFCLLLCNK